MLVTCGSCDSASRSRLSVCGWRRPHYGAVTLTNAGDEAWHPQFNKAHSGFDEMELRRKGGLEGFVGTRDRNDGKRAQRFRAVVEAAIDRCLDRK